MTKAEYNSIWLVRVKESTMSLDYFTLNYLIQTYAAKTGDYRRDFTAV